MESQVMPVDHPSYEKLTLADSTEIDRAAFGEFITGWLSD